MLKGLSGVFIRSQLGQMEAPGQRWDRPPLGVALGGGVSGELLWSIREPRDSLRGSLCILDIRKGTDGEILKEDYKRQESRVSIVNKNIQGP